MKYIPLYLLFSNYKDDLYMPMLKYVFTNVAPQVDFSDMKVRDEVASAVERFEVHCFINLFIY